MGREVSEEIYSSSDGMACGGGWFSGGVIIDGRPEVVVVGVDSLYLGSM